MGDDGTGLRRIVEVEGGQSAPSVSPDGRTIRWTSLFDANTHVFEVDLEGGDVRQVTSGDQTPGSVSTRADGRYMAYTSKDPVSPADNLKRTRQWFVHWLADAAAVADEAGGTRSCPESEIR